MHHHVLDSHINRPSGLEGSVGPQKPRLVYDVQPFIFKYCASKNSPAHLVFVFYIYPFKASINVVLNVYESVSRQLCLTLCNPMDCSPQVPLPMEFSKQENFGGLSFHSPGDLPNPRIESGSSALQADSLPPKSPGKPHVYNFP